MMYILTEEEYKKLRDRPVLGIDKKQLQTLCTDICNAMPVKVDWMDTIEPWQCILTTSGDHYCDECPVKLICPHPYKEWSK